MCLGKLLQHFIKWKKMELVWQKAIVCRARMGQDLNNTFKVLIAMVKTLSSVG